jgi:hypothetical protein
MPFTKLNGKSEINKEVRKMRNSLHSLLCIIMMAMFFFAPTAFAGEGSNIYWVHPSGSASWSTCESQTDPGSNYCALSTANSYAEQGDTVYLKGGDYNYSGAVRAIEPSNSGTSENKITFEAAPGETPNIVKTDGPTVRNSYGVYLSSSKSYIVVKGITFVDWWGGFSSTGGDYNEIADCTFYQTVEVGSFHGMSLDQGSTHNWIHDNTVYNWAGKPGCLEGNDGIKLGGTHSVSQDNYNTIENNTLYHMGHTTTEDFGMYNVWRNNVAHNEGWKVDPGNCENYQPDPVGSDPGDGKYGHRVFSATGYDNSNPLKYGLWEDNRMGHASVNPANNGADGFTLGSPGNIVRYNKVFGGDGPGIVLKHYGREDGERNRIYNNTIYKNARFTGTHSPSKANVVLAGFQKYSFSSVNNIVKNNIIYGHLRDFSCSGSGCDFDDWTIENNLCDAETNNTNCGGSTCTTSGCTALTGNPFASGATDMTDMMSTTNPTLELSSDSQAIDGGTYLTQANGSGSNSTTLIVDDSLYFQCGTNCSTTPMGSALANVQADWIAIGTVNNVVQISDINHSTNTITLASAMTWSDNANIWLYKKSDGEIVLHGSAPDQGAHEFGGGGNRRITFEALSIEDRLFQEYRMKMGLLGIEDLDEQAVGEVADYALELGIPIQYHPSENVEVYIRFPKSRPPTSWRTLERDGPSYRDSEHNTRLTRMGGKPTLKLALAKPRFLCSYIIDWNW